MSHALIRTNPTGRGQKFIGRCHKCGTESLPISAAAQDCPADALVSDSSALLDVLSNQGRNRHRKFMSNDDWVQRERGRD